MSEHPRARIARLFDLALAYEQSYRHPPQVLAPGMMPTLEGRWRIYRFSRTAEPAVATGRKLFDWPEHSDMGAS